METHETMDVCAALTLAMSIEDMSLETGKPKEIILKEVLESKAYECLYDFESGLWGQGPDYFREHYERVSEKAILTETDSKTD